MIRRPERKCHKTGLGLPGIETLEQMQAGAACYFVARRAVGAGCVAGPEAGRVASCVVGAGGGTYLAMVARRSVTDKGSLPFRGPDDIGLLPGASSSMVPVRRTLSPLTSFNRAGWAL